MNKIDSLSQQFGTIPFFDGMTDPQRTALAGASSERRHGKGALLFQKGDRPTGLLVVLSGTIKLSCQSPRGEEKVIELAGPGQVCGEAAVLLDSPYPYTATALTPVRLLHVDGQALRELFAACAGFARRMLARIAHGICTVLDDLEDFRLRSPPHRIARFLLDHCAAAGTTGGAITFPAPKNIVASRLGMVPESLSRAMRDLADAGLIEIGKDHIRVLDRQRLAVLVD